MAIRDIIFQDHGGLSRGWHDSPAKFCSGCNFEGPFMYCRCNDLAGVVLGGESKELLIDRGGDLT